MSLADFSDTQIAFLGLFVIGIYYIAVKLYVEAKRKRPRR